MAESDEFGIDANSNSDCKDKTVEKSSFKNLNEFAWYLIPKARLAFTQLRKMFTKAPIFWQFDLECYIKIKTDMLGYATGKVLSQLTWNNSGQWYLVAYYLQKIISAKT